MGTSPAYVDKGADEIPYHVMKETAAGNAVIEDVSTTVPGGLIDGPNASPRWKFGIERDVSWVIGSLLERGGRVKSGMGNADDHRRGFAD
jgi:hypothetical protein